MATLVLGTAGAAIGGAVAPGLSAAGGIITGAAIGRAVGTVAGAFIDAELFGATGEAIDPGGLEPPRLDSLQVTSSAAGSPIPRLYGRARLGGQMIWATNLEEVVETVQTGGGEEQDSGGGLFGKGLGSPETSDPQSGTRTEYKYFANFAIGLCEGEISHIGRVWADGRELDLSNFEYRVYQGTESQNKDNLIKNKEGADNTPAYRGTAYIVFERMALEEFGNRIPQINVEVFRPVDGLEKAVTAIDIIPASTEFGYEPSKTVKRTDGFGFWIPTNKNTTQGGVDWKVSIGFMEDIFANMKHTNLFVAWFGDDLRCDQCDLRPKVDQPEKETKPYSWEVQSLGRADVPVVSSVDGGPAFGGTPADRSVVDALIDLQDRGFKAVLTPFILMDVPEGNTLTDPYTGDPSQPVYPWRGRITCDPAPGASGSVDQTAAARTQMETFLGSCATTDFVIDGKTVIYTGPAEWSYRRFILHYAHIAKIVKQEASAIDAFVIGTEQPFTTFVRDQNDDFPFVDGLVQLAADVKSVIGGGTKVVYAADWSEFVPYQTSKFGGPSGEIFFHLDPLWSSGDIDAIGIDNYWPLSDWRDGTSHLDFTAGTKTIYDLDYLKGNIAGGEGYDWFYEDFAAREAQNRTNITDSEGKPWVFRFKDIKNWWKSKHFDRPGGVENSSSTGWVKESKPIWMMELGCPAANKGSNQPNVFFDPKSSESFFPYFSTGQRDDFMQRRHITAFLEYWDPDHEDFQNSNNPQSSVYSGRMVDHERVFIYAWDARPYPAFPNLSTVWSDGDLWPTGHWLTGRMSAAPLSPTIIKILADYGFEGIPVNAVDGELSGYLIDRTMSPRDALSPLTSVFFFDAVESEGTLTFKAREQAGSIATVGFDDVVDTGQARISVVRGQETELPGRARISYQDAEADYESASVESLKLTGASLRTSSVSLPATGRQSIFFAQAEKLLREQWAARERITLALPPSLLKADPGDLITVQTAGREITARITRTTLGDSMQVEALSHEPAVYGALDAPDNSAPPKQPAVYGVPQVAFMDLPIITGSEVPHAGAVAAYGKPWGGVSVFRSPDVSGFKLNRQLSSPANLGETEFDLFSGPTSRFDFGNLLRIRIFNTEVELASVTELQLFEGANTLAVEGADGNWEVLQFRDVQLVSTGVYDISALLRGQHGTEDAMADPVASGARVVLLDGRQRQVAMQQDQIALPFNWRYGPSPVAIDDDTYTTINKAFTGRGLKPFSPVHVAGSRDGAGDLTISWIRRTRANGDNWEQDVVPLNEASEAYEIDVLDGANVVRTLESASASVVYTAAQQATDFGSAQSSVDVAVYQMSETVGRGTARAATV